MASPSRSEMFFRNVVRTAFMYVAHWFAWLVQVADDGQDRFQGHRWGRKGVANAVCHITQCSDNEGRLVDIGSLSRSGGRPTESHIKAYQDKKLDKSRQYCWARVKRHDSAKPVLSGWESKQMQNGCDMLQMVLSW